MVGLGVRLGTSGKIEDSVDYDGDTVNLRGSYLRFRTDQGAMFPAYVELLRLTSCRRYQLYPWQSPSSGFELLLRVRQTQTLALHLRQPPPMSVFG